MFFLLLISITQIKAQGNIGDITSPYSTTGWDAPVDSTKYYNLFIFTLLTNPGGWRNLNTVIIDSLFNELVVFTDKKQLWIEDDTLHFSDTLSFQGSFSGTAQYDTTVIPGVDSLDIVVACVREAIPTANDILGVKIISNKVIVQRAASGTSGLKYNCIWIRKYQ